MPQNVRRADEAGVSTETDLEPDPAGRAAAGSVHDPDGRALRRGLLLLAAVQRGGEAGLRVVDLCRALGLERATVYRLLATLIECGHVQKSGRWRYVASTAPGSLAAAAGAAGHAAEMTRRLAPVLARISEGCGDAAFAVVRDGHSSWCVARHIGSYPVQILVVQVGNRQPLGVGAAGLALLAALPDDEVEAAIASHADALARYGGMTPERLRLLVRTTRERGWSVVGNHAVQGALGVGRAVRGRDGRALAGVSVAASLERMTRQHQRLIAGLMRDALADLSL